MDRLNSRIIHIPEAAAAAANIHSDGPADRVRQQGEFVHEGSDSDSMNEDAISTANNYDATSEVMDNENNMPAQAYRSSVGLDYDAGAEILNRQRVVQHKMDKLQEEVQRLQRSLGGPQNDL